MFIDCRISIHFLLTEILYWNFPFLCHIYPDLLSQISLRNPTWTLLFLERKDIPWFLICNVVLHVYNSWIGIPVICCCCNPKHVDSPLCVDSDWSENLDTVNCAALVCLLSVLNMRLCASLHCHQLCLTKILYGRNI